jgi:ribosomal protein L20
MKLPNWAKLLWWLFLLLIITSFLLKRYLALASGSGTPVDVFIFIIWVVLFLLPLFQEMSFFGFTFKKEIEAIKSEVKEQVASIRSEIRSNVSVRSEISQQFMYPPPVPDSRLPELEERVRSAVEEALRRYGMSSLRESTRQIAVGDDVTFLFWARYSIEREMRRIWFERFDKDSHRHSVLVNRIIQTLVDTQLIDPALARATREVYLVCSPAIHGEEVTPAQVAFVRNVAPGLITALKAIQ